MATSILTTGDPITGTAEDDFILPRDPQGDNIIDGGGGDDLVLGDAPPVFYWQQAFLNGSMADARSLDDANYWFAYGFDYAPLTTGGPILAALVEASAGEAEWFSVTVDNSQSIRVDVDFGVGAIGVAVDTSIDLFGSDGHLIATSDDDAAGNEPAVTAQTADAYLDTRLPIGETIVYIRVRPTGGAVFTGGETFLLNVNPSHHDTAAAITTGDDTLNGGAGDDALYGGGGDNVLNGGPGNDDLYAGGVGDGFHTGTELVHGGTGDDTIWTVYVGGRYFGDAGDDRFVVDRSINRQYLDGGAGTDTLDASYLASSGPFRFDMATGQTSSPTQSWINFENYVGSAFYQFGSVVTGTDGANVVRCNLGADTIDARGGNDVVEGGAGADAMAGGAGVDTLSYASSVDGVTVLLALGFALGGDAGAQSGHDTFSGFENVEGSNAVDAIIGDDGANMLAGAGGDDTLGGGRGDDRLLGGDGDDTLIGSLGDDLLSGGAGVDLASYADAAAAVSVSLRLSGAQATGGGGVDQLVSIENLTGSDYADRLTGSAAANALAGGAGNDVLIGSGGADRLTGGGGADRFVFGPADVQAALGRAGRIVDFSQSEHDRIDLSAIDADRAHSGAQSFAFIGRADFSGAAGELRYAFAGVDTIVSADIDGDRKADLVLRVDGRVQLTAADFVAASAPDAAPVAVLGHWAANHPWPIALDAHMVLA